MAMTAVACAADQASPIVTTVGFQFRPYQVTTQNNHVIPSYQLVLCEYGSWTANKVNGVAVPADHGPNHIKVALHWAQLMCLDKNPSLVDLGAPPGCEKYTMKFLKAVNESAVKQDGKPIFDFHYDNARRLGLNKNKKRPAVDEAVSDEIGSNSRLAKVLKTAPGAVRAVGRALGFNVKTPASPSSSSSSPSSSSSASTDTSQLFSQPSTIPSPASTTAAISIDFLGSNRPPSAAAVFLASSHQLLALAHSTHETARRAFKTRELIHGQFSTMSGVELSSATDTLERGVRKAVADALDDVPRGVSMSPAQCMDYLGLRQHLNMQDIVDERWSDSDITMHDTPSEGPPPPPPADLYPSRQHINFGAPIRPLLPASSSADSLGYAQPAQPAHDLVALGYNQATFGFLAGGRGNDDQDTASVYSDSASDSASLQMGDRMGQLGLMGNSRWEWDE